MKGEDNERGEKNEKRRKKKKKKSVCGENSSTTFSRTDKASAVKIPVEERLDLAPQINNTRKLGNNPHDDKYDKYSTANINSYIILCRHK